MAKRKHKFSPATREHLLSDAMVSKVARKMVPIYLQDKTYEDLNRIEKDGFFGYAAVIIAEILRDE